MNHLRLSPPRGMSLIEVLVGLAIGVVGLLAISQVVSVWDRRTQTSTSGGDAQISGTLAIFNIERDLKHAGFGFATADVTTMGCAVQASDVSPARVFSFAMSPVEIVPGVGGAPDAINVLHGNSSFFVSSQAFTASTGTTKRLARRNGFKPGDLAIVASSGAASAASANCALIEITDDSDPDGYTIAHTTAAYTPSILYGAASAVPRFNPAAASAPAFTSGVMFDLGPRPLPQRNTWSVANFHTLVRRDLIFGAAAQEIAEGVINLKAQYGVDADGNGQITDAEWVADPIANPPTDWTRVLAIRVAVLVRSRQFERSGDAAASGTAATTVAAPTWVGGTFLMTNVDGTADSFSATTVDPNNWRYYRYRVYERVIPLRNMIWATAP